MPKSTFFNLSDEKRDQILQVAIDEFANNDYASASISHIVACAEIAKGSFYQYFVDKEDLYVYLLDLLAGKKREFFSLDHPDPEHIGVFAYLRWLGRSNVVFELAYPALSRIGYRAVLAGPYPAAAYRRARNEAMAFYRRVVELGMQQKEIDVDLDPEVAAFMFDAVLTNLGTYWLQQMATAGNPMVMIEQPFSDRADAHDFFATAVSILEHGMRRSAQHG